MPSTGGAFPTAAASRAYYALFQAVIAEFVAEGKSPLSFSAEAQRWRHDIVSGNLRGAIKLLSCKDIKQTYKRLRASRETADYGPGSVDESDVRKNLADLRATLLHCGIS